MEAILEGLRVELGKVVVDARGLVISADAQAHLLLGFAPRTLPGKVFQTIAFDGWPSEKQRFEALCAGTENSFRWERRLERPHSTAVWLSLCGTAIPSPAGSNLHTLVTLEDVTARHLFDESSYRLANEQSARKRVAFLADASVALSSSLEHATTLERLAQLAVPELADLCAVELIGPDGVVRRAAYATARPELDAALIIKSQEGRTTRGPLVSSVLNQARTQLWASLDGTEHPASTKEWAAFTGGLPLSSLILAPLRHAMTTFGFVIFARVVPSTAHGEGDVVLAEELARRAALAMDNARLYSEAREASRLKDDFLALISHELRTPLMPILGWAQLLSDPTTPPDVMANGLATIERNARNQAQLIDDLLDVSRVMSGKLYLEPNVMRLDVTVREVVAALRTSATARRVNLHYHPADTVAPLIGDPSRLQQVATNLISNAIKFTPPGGNVIVTVERVSGRIILKVTDTGQGIEAEFLPYVFDRFRQGESATTRKYGGLGLGLSIVRDIVELHGGTVTAESEGAFRGSTFTVKLPEAPSDMTAAFPSMAPKEVPAVRLDDTVVLFVGEDTDSNAIVTHQLKGLGATVLVAVSDENALTVLKKERPAVLLCDVTATGAANEALLGKIRQLPEAEGGQVPAIALSAFTRVEDGEGSLRAGFSRHVSKPANLVDLANAILDVKGVAVASAPVGSAKPSKPRARKTTRNK